VPGLARRRARLARRQFFQAHLLTPEKLADKRQRLVCHHERLDGDDWVPSMGVILIRPA
jgi:hypothetical protein